MNRQWVRCLLMLAAMLPATVQAATPENGGHAAHGKGSGSAWTKYPLLLRGALPKGTDMRSNARFVVRNLQASELAAYAPDGTAFRVLPLSAEGAQLHTGKSGNYYWVVAREESPEKVVVASTTYFSPNHGPAPRKMLLETRHELEIVPQPLPREHSSYRENEDWKFLVRFNGKPLAGQKLQLETEHGSKASFMTDAQGLATVHFPADYRHEEQQSAGAGHNHRMRRAGFVLETGYTAQGRQYLTAFNYVYGPDAYATRNLALGLGFVVLGMAMATPLLRRKTDDAGKRGA